MESAWNSPPEKGTLAYNLLAAQFWPKPQCTYDPQSYLKDVTPEKRHESHSLESESHTHWVGMEPLPVHWFQRPVNVAKHEIHVPKSSRDIVPFQAKPPEPVPQPPELVPLPAEKIIDKPIYVAPQHCIPRVPAQVPATYSRSIFRKTYNIPEDDRDLEI